MQHMQHAVDMISSTLNPIEVGERIAEVVEQKAQDEKQVDKKKKQVEQNVSSTYLKFLKIGI